MREEVCAEYDRHLVQVESRLKNELESLEAREESLTSELRTRDSQLTEEKAKVKQCLEMLESELQCSICSELFINVSASCSTPLSFSSPYEHNKRVKLKQVTPLLLTTFRIMSLKYSKRNGAKCSRKLSGGTRHFRFTDPSPN